MNQEFEKPEIIFVLGIIVHWLPVKKTEEFQPLTRAADWSRARHERFNWLAKNELLKLGYEPLEFEGNKFYWRMRNQFQDLLWRAKVWRHRFGRVPKFLEKRFKIYFGK